jgi:hypothetical protein
MQVRRVVTSKTKYRVAAGCIAMWMVATASAGARQGDVLTGPQVQSGVLIQTGLLTFFTGEKRFVGVTVTELGAPESRSTVRVAFYDAADRLVFREEGVLQRGFPVRIELPLHMADKLVQLRMSAEIVGRPGRDSIPILVLESIDLDAFAIEERVFCAPPEDKQGATPWCPPPAVATSFTTRG